MQNPAKKNVLITVFIPPHFREMIRVARLLKTTEHYNPIILFQAAYQSYQDDIAICKAEEIDVVLPDAIHTYHQLNPQLKNSGQANSASRIRMVLLKLCMVFFVAFHAITRGVLFLLNTGWRIFKKAFKWGFNYIKNKIFALARKVKLFFTQIFYLLKKQIITGKAASMALFYKSKFWLTRHIVYLKFLTACGTQKLVLKCAFIMRFMLRIMTYRGERLEKISKKHPSFFKALAHTFFKAIWPGYLFLLKRDRDSLLMPALRYIYLNYKSIPHFLKAINPSLLIIPEDNLFYLTPFFIHFAKKQASAPTVIVPFTIVNTKEWATVFHADPRAHVDNFLKMLIASRYPHWTHSHKDKQLLLFMDYVLAYEHLKLAPPIPWLINSGFADAIAVESPFMQQYYQEAGLAREKLIVTGALYDDDLHKKYQDTHTKRQIFYEELALAPQLPIVLCALPPNQLEGDVGRCDFESYRDLLEFWVATLAQYSDRYHILLNPHPRIKQEELQFIEQYNVHIVKRDIAELVPLAYVFVASCSATIRLAIGCGIPVINYDVFRYDYGDYNSAKGVITFQEQAEFIQTVDTLLCCPDYYQETTQAQQAASKEWAFLDGQCGERMLHLLDNLTNQNKLVNFNSNTQVIKTKYYAGEVCG